jgi:hypothetical protein
VKEIPELKVHPGASSVDEAARECWAHSGRTVAGHQEQPCQAQQFPEQPLPEELSEHRPCRAEEAAAVPTKSDRGAEPAPASRESPNLWQPDSKEQESKARLARVSGLAELAPAEQRAESEQPDVGQPGVEPPDAQQGDAELALHAVSASPVARNSAPSITAAATAEPGEPAALEHLPQALFPGFL